MNIISPLRAAQSRRTRGRTADRASSILANQIRPATFDPVAYAAALEVLG